MNRDSMPYLACALLGEFSPIGNMAGQGMRIACSLAFAIAGLFFGRRLEKASGSCGAMRNASIRFVLPKHDRWWRVKKLNC